MDMARVVQGLQTVGYVLLGLVGLVMAVWVYFWPYSEYFAVERNLPGEPFMPFKDRSLAPEPTYRA